MIKSIRLSVLVVSLVALSLAPSAFAQCTTATASQPSTPSGDDVLIDDSLPSGASVSSGSLNWDSSQSATGSQSFSLSGSGTQTVEIDDLSQFFRFTSTGKAVVYVLIDECDPTTEIKVSYHSPYRDVAVYWGANNIGADPGVIQFSRGALPTAGVWTRLEIPIKTPLNLQGHTVTRMKFQISGGRVWFDRIGTDGTGCTPSTASSPSPSGGTVWVDDTIPGYSYMSYGEPWDTQAANGTLSFAYPYYGQNATGVVRVNDLNEATSVGDDLFLYVMATGCETLKQLKVTWYSGASYQNSGCIWYGTIGVPSLGGESNCTFMGSTVPAADTWTKLSIPAATIGLDGHTITSFKVENLGTQVFVDYVGNEP